MKSTACACSVLASMASVSAFVTPNSFTANTKVVPGRANLKRTRPNMSTPSEAVPTTEVPEPELVQTGPEYLATLPGSGAPLGIFDPLGIASKFRAIDVKKFRESEVKHGRVAMLAFIGMLLQELAHPLYNGGADLGPAIYHMQAIESDFPLAPIMLFVLIGVLEGNNIYGKYSSAYFGWEKQPIKEGIADLKEDFAPGDLGFDPLGLYGKDAASKQAMGTKELNNGRLAMLAVVGIWAQELVDGKTILGHFL
ncbi:unnamed protein product [Choristocarpus tenellus]